MTATPYGPDSRRSSAGTSNWVDLDGPVHYVDHGGPAGAPLLVLVHGLGGSHANWAALVPLLVGDYRVLALDLAGFGLTPGHSRPTTVAGNRLLLDRFLRQVADEPVVLIGNSMGALISALQAAAAPETVGALVLINPALPPAASVPDKLTVTTFAEFALPERARRYLARNRPPVTADQAAVHLVNFCCADPSRVPQEVIDEHIALSRQRQSIPDIEADFMMAARSLGWAMVHRRRYAAMLRSLRMPVMMMHGDKDRLIPIRAARTAAVANPRWRFEVAAGVGHVPMLEVPRWTANHLLEWIPAALATAEKDREKAATQAASKQAAVEQAELEASEREASEREASEREASGLEASELDGAELK